MVALCLFEFTHFGARVAFELVRCHPKVLVGKHLVRSPNYQPPGTFVASGEGPGGRPPSPASRAWRRGVVG
jgi:hypothetical protein